MARRRSVEWTGLKSNGIGGEAIGVGGGEGTHAPRLEETPI
jgi:hypothetical protein